MDPLTMFSCPFRHDTTLQQHRLLSITANVTSWGAARTSENPQKAKFAERQKAEVQLRRISIPRTPVNKGKKGWAPHPGPLLSCRPQMRGGSQKIHRGFIAGWLEWQREREG